MTKYIRTIITLLIAFSVYGITNENAKAVIILDASGSMWGQVDGKAKISIAKEALHSVVKKWNTEVELGLTVYGHRTKGDCSDIETVVPVGKIDKTKLLNIVKNIQPKGKTPISASLQKVAKEMKYSEEKATIILISDGKESCDADPCDTAKELEKQGIDFVAHVVGFNVDKKTDAQLECIADATGGEYFSAQDADALNNAMDSIVKKVEKIKPIIKKPKDNLTITASESKSGKKTNKVYHLVYVMNEDELGKIVGRCYAKHKECKHSLPLGKYVIESKYNTLNIHTPFEISSLDNMKVHVILGTTGTVNISASETKNAKMTNKAYHLTYLMEDGEMGDIVGRCYAKHKECKHHLPVGDYTIVSEYFGHKVNTLFKVKAGETNDVNVLLGETGSVNITAFETKNAKMTNKAYHLTYLMEDSEMGNIVGRCYSKHKECKHRLPVGDYTIVSEYFGYKIDTPFKITVGETHDTKVILGETGTVNITTYMTKGGKVTNKAYLKVYKMQDNELGDIVGRCYAKYDACKLRLPVGKYVIKTNFEQESIQAEIEITVGKTTQARLILKSLS